MSGSGRLRRSLSRSISQAISADIDLESSSGRVKEFSSLNLSKHRSVINAFVHIIAAITAYQINPIRPKRNLQPRYYLETAA